MKRLSIKYLDKVVGILSDDRVFNFINDDASSHKSTLKRTATALLTNVTVYVMMPIDDMLLIFIPMNGVMYDMHIASLVKNVKAAAQQTVLWMTENTPVEKFITQVPEYNRAAMLFAQRCGLKKEGLLKKAFKKNGVLHDITVFGTTKQEVQEALKCQ